MDKIEERAKKFIDDNNYVITVLSDDKENDYTWMHNENTVLADFAKQEREAVRAEMINKIEARLAEKESICVEENSPHQDKAQFALNARKNELRGVLNSLKGDE